MKLQIHRIPPSKHEPSYLILVRGELLRPPSPYGWVEKIDPRWTTCGAGT